MENCSDKCQSQSNMKCITKCGEIFKENYHKEMNEILNSNYSKIV